MLHDVHNEEGTNRPAELFDLPSPITSREILEEQRIEDFCETILATQVGHHDDTSLEHSDGVLSRWDPQEPDCTQTVLPYSLHS